MFSARSLPIRSTIASAGQVWVRHCPHFAGNRVAFTHLGVPDRNDCTGRIGGLGAPPNTCRPASTQLGGGRNGSVAITKKAAICALAGSSLKSLQGVEPLLILRPWRKASDVLSISKLPVRTGRRKKLCSTPGFLIPILAAMITNVTPPDAPFSPTWKRLQSALGSRACPNGRYEILAKRRRVHRAEASRLTETSSIRANAKSVYG